MKTVSTNVYLGRLGNEKKLCAYDGDISPSKGDIIFYDEELYKVMYCLFDMDNDEYSVFVRLATEEDY